MLYMYLDSRYAYVHRRGNSVYLVYLSENFEMKIFNLNIPVPLKPFKKYFLKQLWEFSFYSTGYIAWDSGYDEYIHIKNSFLKLYFD